MESSRTSMASRSIPHVATLPTAIPYFAADIASAWDIRAHIFTSTIRSCNARLSCNADPAEVVTLSLAVTSTVFRSIGAVLIAGKIIRGRLEYP